MSHRVAMLIVAALALLAVGGCGSSGTKTITLTSTATRSTAPSPATPITTISSSMSSGAAGSASSVVHLDTFQSPSGNIGCTIIAGTARCDIKQRSWSPPPRPRSCPQIVDFGQGLIVGASGPARLVCAGDTSLNPAAKELPYNTDTVMGGFRCQSRSTGIVCRSTASGHGFFLSSEAYRIF